MRRIQKRDLICLAASVLALALGFVLAGCGKASGGGDALPLPVGEAVLPEETSTEDAREELSWRADYRDLTERYEFAVVADRIYGCSMRDGEAVLECFGKAGAGRTVVILPDVSALAGMAADQEGNVYLLGKQRDADGFWRISEEGVPGDFTEILLDDVEEADDLVLRGIYTDGRGNLFFWYKMMVPQTEMVGDFEEKVWHEEDRVYVKDEQMNTVFYQGIADMRGTQVLSLALGETGAPVFIVKDGDGIYVQEMDMESGQLKEPVRLDGLAEALGEYGTAGTEHMIPVDGGLLFCRGNDLCRVRYDAPEPETLLGLSAYGIYAADILAMAVSEEGIEIVDNHGDAEHSEYVSFTRGRADRQTVTLGVLGMPQDLEQAVTEFSRVNSDYRVEIVDYYDEAIGYDDSANRLKLDIVRGEAPDILDLTGIDEDMLTGKGVLADLYGFMREDAECSAGLLMEPVTDAYASGGQLYAVAPAFHLFSMWGYHDVIKGRSGVTFDELIRVLAESGKDLNAIGGFAADEPVLTRLCTVSMDEFVDWENGTCEFDGESFKNVLEFAKEYTGNYSGGSYMERIRGRELVMTVGILDSVADYQAEEALFGEKIDFIGYPVAEGSGTAVTFRGSSIGINAAGKEQAGAWEFVKFYLLHGYHGEGFPVIKQQFEEEMAAAMRDDYRIGEDGSKEPLPKGFYPYGVEGISIYAASEAEVDEVRALIEGASGRAVSHSELQAIIDEEAEAYFAGQADLDRTAEVIQSRAALYLQELQ